MLKTSKKVLSIVLALVLVFSTAVCAFAAFDPSTQKIGFVLVPDKDLTKVENGDTVTFTLYLDVADFSQRVTVGKLLFLYDSSAYSVNNSYKNLGDFAEFYKDGTASALASTSTANWNKLKTGTTQDISAFDKAYVWSGAADTTKDWEGTGGNTAKAGYYLTQAEGTRTVAELQFKFTVLDNTKNMEVMLCDNFATASSLQYFKTTDGTTQTNLDQPEVNVELASAMTNNPAAASILKYSKSQIRFKGITATSGPSTYEGTFDVRTVAKISQADFLATFTSEENAKAKITDFGFVYAAKSNVASFDLATAKAVAEGTPAAGYTKAPVTYMQHTADGADYIFTCLITNINDADKTDGVGCLAYVCFDGAYIYFDAAESVSYNSLYTTYMPVA